MLDLWVKDFMTTKIGISTGVFYKHFKEEEIDKMISFLRNLNVDIIEILYARPFMLDINISDENRFFLNNKKVLIHAPFFENQGYNDIIYDNTLINKLIEKSKFLDVHNIIIHPDLTPNFDYLNEFPGRFIFENLKDERVFTVQKILNLISSGMKIKLSLDIGHLNSNDKLNITKIIKDNKKDIAELQLSIKEDYDDFLTGNINSKYSFLIGLEIPIILETRPKELSHLNIIINNLRKFVQND